MRKGNPIISMLASIAFVLGGCGFVMDIFEKHKRICYSEGKIIVFNSILWNEYLKRSKENYDKRKEKYSDTKRIVNEYVDGFEQRYGENMDKDRKYIDGEILKSNITILKDDEPVAIFVDYIVSRNFLGAPTNLDCTGKYPDIYLEELTPNV